MSYSAIDHVMLQAIFPGIAQQQVKGAFIKRLGGKGIKTTLYGHSRLRFRGWNWGSKKGNLDSSSNPSRDWSPSWIKRNPKSWSCS